MEFQLRDKIDGQYVVTAKHYGGMSVVYICLDEFSQRRFAVKTLKDELLVDRTASERFATEARTWLNLGRHPNIVEAIIYREMAGQPFLFLEYVEGSTLQLLLDQERALFPPQAVRFMLQAATGMAYVHTAQVGPGEHGVIHRDLKPGNMMLTREAVVKITDFGLAKAYGMPSSELDVGVGVGTYLYMPPEQLLDASSADRTSDIYSFGVALYTALAGRTPLRGRTVNQIVRAIMSQQPVPLTHVRPRLPAQLDEIMMLCLAKRREERYQTFDEVKAALEGVLEVVDQACEGAAGTQRCRGCGYLTGFRYPSCPICANTLEVTGFPSAAASLTPAAPTPGTESASAGDAGQAGPTVEAVTAPPAAGDLAPEAAAVAELMGSAGKWRDQGDFQRAANLLRQAVTIMPGHIEARRALDEVVLAMARQRPRSPQKAYNWPMFRGSITRTGMTPEIVAPPLGRRWQHKVGDWILASPVVSNGIVYIGGRLDRPALQGHFVAVHAATGQAVWEYDTAHEILLSACVLGGQTVLAASLSRLHAFDARTGHHQWDAGVNGNLTADPLAWQGVVYLGAEDGTLHALSAQNGQRVWSFKAEMAIYSSPLVWEHRVFFGSNDHRLYALDQHRGRLLWEFMAASEITSTPAYQQGRVYVSSRDQRLYCLDASTGRRIWEFATAGACTGSPALWQDTVYVGSRDKHLYALDAGTGACRWRFEADDWVESSPAVSGQTLYFGCHNGRLYAVEVETGVLLWEYETGGEVSSSPAVSGGRVFVGSNDGCLYCFAAKP